MPLESQFLSTVRFRVPLEPKSSKFMRVSASLKHDGALLYQVETPYCTLADLRAFLDYMGEAAETAPEHRGRDQVMLQAWIASLPESVAEHAALMRD